MKITTLTPQQKNDWLILWQGYLNFYQTELADAITEHTWQHIIDDTSPTFGFGAFDNAQDNDQLIAIAHVTLHEHTWTIQPCCYLIDLFVSPQARGQGVGRAMIEFIYQFATDNHCSRVYWVTKEHNVTARALYDKIATQTDFVQYRHNLL